MTVYIDGEKIEEGVSSAVVLSSGRAVGTVAAQLLGSGFQVISGCVVTLPGAGTYRVYYAARANSFASSNWATFRLFNVTDAVALVETEGIPHLLVGQVITIHQTSVTMETNVTVTGATTIRLDGKGNDAVNSECRSDASGRTVIGFNQIS